jgi:hypothetical protein
MRYPAVRNCLNGSSVLYHLPATDVDDSSEGRGIARVRMTRSPSVAGTSPSSAWATSPSP